MLPDRRSKIYLFALHSAILLRVPNVRFFTSVRLVMFLRAKPKADNSLPFLFFSSVLA